MAKQERALRTRNALIESAAELFTRDGYETVPLSAISARAGVSNGALHFHFASKAALAGAVGGAAVLRFGRITAAQRPPGAGGSLQTLIDVSHVLLHALGHDVVLRAGFDLCDGQERCGADENLRRRWQQWVEESLVRAEREGLLARGVAARDVVTVVVAATVGLATLGARDIRWMSPSRLTRFWVLLLPGLARPAALGVLEASGRRVAAGGGGPVPMARAAAGRC
ncbi:ScbR family autoregulator-binding transcription factor [Streptomyces sp. NPDC008313]|uniref:ScbR family autoregulator-binding transcription factor n=1 Tax=Streptomyces sp. NPDC008313 TaxID=3364826 RepID=UPI0036EEB480